MVYAEPDIRFRLDTIRNCGSGCILPVGSGRDNRPWRARPMKTAELSTSSSPEISAERSLRADARRNREAVIAAAKKLFADQGLDAQMPDVARVAKVGVGTVYRHFRTKDELIAALVADRFERLAEKAREGLQAGDPWQGFCDFIRFAAQIQAD